MDQMKSSDGLLSDNAQIKWASFLAEMEILKNQEKSLVERATTQGVTLGRLQEKVGRLEIGLTAATGSTNDVQRKIESVERRRN